MGKEPAVKVETNKLACVIAELQSGDIPPAETKNNHNAAANCTTASGSATKPQQSSMKTTIKKQKRQKTPKDVNAPKHPLTGYVRYMNETRETVRQKNPSLTPIEVTKILAEEWSNLPEEKKKPYLEAAEADKERYNKEISEYKLNKDPKAKAKLNDLTHMNEHVSVANATGPSIPYLNGKTKPKEIRCGNYDIPIFTEDFLDHNKVVDSELRTLRKSNIDYEQQNSVLEKHVENMENGVEKLESETCSLVARNAVLEKYLLNLRSTLANSLQALPLDNECTGATIENIDQYLANLHQMADSSAQGHTLNKAKDILRKLDLYNLMP